MKHYNPSISADMNRILNLKGESTNEIEDVIVPIIPIQRRADIVRTLTKTSTGGSLVFTTAADKDTYITAVSLNYSADNASDGVKISLSGTVDGVSREILTLCKITLTAANHTCSLCFTNPIRLDRNTSVTLTHAFTVGTERSCCNVIGYTVETITQGVN